MDINEQYHVQNEWDQIAQIRFEDLENRIDKSYEMILKPSILNKLKKQKYKSILDYGCGTGNLTNDMKLFTAKIVGYDISHKSIEIAQKHFNDTRIEFINSLRGLKKVDTVISNMVLMDVEDLDKSIKEIKDILNINGKLIFTIIHPCFWPIYWDYFYKENFKYLNQYTIKRNFRTADKNYDYITTHFHRPLHDYIKILMKNNFVLTEFEELGNQDLSDKFPRFIIFECILSK